MGKTGIKSVALFVAVAAALLVMPVMSSAQQSALPQYVSASPTSPLTSYNGSVNVGAAVRMVRAAYVKVAFVVVEFTQMDIVDDVAENVDDLILNKAYVQVTGIPGETAVLTCNIANSQGGERDCSGAAMVSAHALVAGERSNINFENGVLDDTNAGNRISIDVTYL